MPLLNLVSKEFEPFGETAELKGATLVGWDKVEIYLTTGNKICCICTESLCPNSDII